MMLLKQLLSGVTDIEQDLAVTGLSLDSRNLTTGQVFVAMPTLGSMSLSYITQAVAQGASAVIYDAADRRVAEFELSFSGRPFIAVEALSTQLGVIAARFYADPSRHLDVIGITGTNGKTSCSQFLGQLLDHCGIVGTLGWGRWGDLTFTGYTTPDAVMTQGILARLVGQGVCSVAMEVSSHGLAEGRVEGVAFKGVVLTNISRDHLDFHGSMEAYIATKQTLFTRPEPQFAVFNLNEPFSEAFMAMVPKAVAIWGFQVLPAPQAANNRSLPASQCVIARHVQHRAEGLAFELSWQDQLRKVSVPLYGSFNVDNVLTVVSVMLALGHSLDAIIDKTQHLQPVPGRMQRLGNSQSALIFVDYAHTPDALEKALISTRQHCQRALWVVFGCGGDRDAGKRPQMGAYAVQYADHIIITDDNPRSESPEVITHAILAGCEGLVAESQTLQVIHERSEAIRMAITQALPGDCILIAGKGHELYQEIDTQKIPFSDVAVVGCCLAEIEVSA